MLWPNEKCVEEYREERLRIAEQERLIRQVCENPDRNNRTYYRFLSWLGRSMVSWGLGLQKRYSMVVESTSTHPI